MFCMEIKTAFPTRLVTLYQHINKKPKKAKTNKLRHLKKWVYGLSDASLHWYNKVRKVMTSCDGKASTLYPAVIYWHQKGLSASHVDKLIRTGNNCYEKGSYRQEMFYMLSVWMRNHSHHSSTYRSTSLCKVRLYKAWPRRTLNNFRLSKHGIEREKGRGQIHLCEQR